MRIRSVTLARSIRGYIAKFTVQWGVGILLFAMVGTATPASEPVVVKPLIANINEEIFQTLIVMHGLKDLGFDVQDITRADNYAQANHAVATGDATFMAGHWQPLHNPFFHKAGGQAVLSREGELISNAQQGYLIDEKTALQYKITHLDQLKEPRLAALFDVDGDGKADLTGCQEGWGCAAVIEHQLARFGLNKAVTHHQHDYKAQILDKIARVHRGQPALFYTWTPYWVTAALALGQQRAIWLQVPYSSLPPPRQNNDTKLLDGRNLGFALNSQHILANRAFVQANPVAGLFFKLAQIPVNDVSDQNLRMNLGEDSRPDIERHAREWIAANRQKYDSWLTRARKANPQK